MRSTCQKGDQCRYEHQVDNDGRPVPVGPEILQKFDEAVKRFNESKAQAKAKAAPRGGVTASMIVLEPEATVTGVVACAARAPDSDKYYAMVDSGTNAIIVPLHPNMKGEIAECQVASATVTGPIVQVYEHRGTKRLVVALPNSAILVSQEWLTTIVKWTIVKWTFVSGPPRTKGECECVVYPPGREAYKLEVKNGLPYLSKELFWLAMCDIASQSNLVSGHSWMELRDMLDEQAQEPQPQIYSVKAVTVPKAPLVVLSPVSSTKHFQPWKARLDVIAWFEEFHPPSNPNRGRLSGTAQSLTFGAQTGRGSERSCVIKRTTDYKYSGLISLVHQLAQNAVGPALPYLGFQILKLGVGQNLNQHRDYPSHPDYPNHTMKLGKYQGGLLQMLRDGEWCSYDKENQWLSFDALKVVHQVTAVTKGERFSITLYTPRKTRAFDCTGLGHLGQGRFPYLLVRATACENEKTINTNSCDDPHTRSKAN